MTTNRNPEYIVRDIMLHNYLDAITDRQQETIILIIQDEELSIEDKTNLIMKELEIKGQRIKQNIHTILEYNII